MKNLLSEVQTVKRILRVYVFNTFEEKTESTNAKWTLHIQGHLLDEVFF